MRALVKDKGFPTNYELRKPIIDLRAAKALFSQTFLTAAFEAGAHRSRSKTQDSSTQQPSNLALRRWINKEGHDAVARACLAYALALEHQIDRPAETKFEDLLRQIAHGATRIAQAADTLAAQLLTHYQESGQVDRLRAEALYRLGHALQGGFDEGVGSFEPSLVPRLGGHPLGGLDMKHGLANCVMLADRAERVLEDYRAWAKIVRAAPPARRGATASKPKTLPMKSGKRPNRDRDAFIEDLAAIYERGSGYQAKANRGSSTNGDVSPFVRFVERVFHELRAQSYLPNDDRFGAPTVDAIRAALKRRQGRQKPQKQGAKTAKTSETSDT